MSVEDDKKARPKTRGTYLTEIEEDLDLLRDALKEKSKSIKKYHQMVKNEYQNIKLEEPLPYDDSISESPRKKHPRRGRQKADLGCSTSIIRKGKDSKRKSSPGENSKSDLTPLNTYKVFDSDYCYQIGDIVSIVGKNKKLYFCQIRGFLRDQLSKWHVSIRWLLPTQTVRTHGGQWPGLHGGILRNFNPMMFTEGPEQEKPFSIDQISFVMRPPPALFSAINYGYGFNANDKGWDTPTMTINSADRRF